MYCRKEMVKILKCYLILKKSYGTLSKGAIFLANPVYIHFFLKKQLCKFYVFHVCQISIDTFYAEYISHVIFLVGGNCSSHSCSQFLKN